MYNVIVGYMFTHKYSLVKMAGSQGNLNLKGHVSDRTLTKFSYENLILRNIVIAILLEREWQGLLTLHWKSKSSCSGLTCRNPTSNRKKRSGFWLDTHHTSRARATELSTGERQVAWTLAVCCEMWRQNMASGVYSHCFSFNDLSPTETREHIFLECLSVGQVSSSTTSEMQHHCTLEHAVS